MQLPKRKPGKYSQIPTDHMMSRNKYKELESELTKLKKKRPYAAMEVARLAELGDFSENVEYQLAKRRLRGINSAMLKIEYLINHAQIIKENKGGVVQIGSKVKLKKDGAEVTFKILGASETDPSNNIISHLSPLGSALIGHRVGDTVDIEKIGKSEILEII